MKRPTVTDPAACGRAQIDWPQARAMWLAGVFPEVIALRLGVPLGELVDRANTDLWPRWRQAT
jgi:hypothetical protein